ncbi:MAG: SemiSWEET transporter [Candidatus Liptonbacteria bacterium]|nr:SemiSWEET transporter [Candidatus Liptonbacteria bacterium]
MIITAIGLVAATLTTAAYLPQAIEITQTKKTDELSLGMYIIATTGVFLWLTYGLLIKDIPIIVANAITFVLTGWILILKIKYG